MQKHAKPASRFTDDWVIGFTEYREPSAICMSDWPRGVAGQRVEPLDGTTPSGEHGRINNHWQEPPAD